MGTLSTNARTTGINAARNAAIDAIADTLDAGKLRIYSGTEPTNADSALSGNTLLAELTLGNPAFGAAVNGVSTANAITADSSADATGIPSFFRLLTGADAVVYQGSAGDADFASHSSRELLLSGLSGNNDGTAEIAQGGSVSVSSLTMTQTASYA